MKRDFNDYTSDELNELFESLSEPFVPAVFDESSLYYQTCILGDFLTESDNGVSAIERLNSAFREGTLKFRRGCDMDEDGREIPCDSSKECHNSNIWTVFPKGTKGYLTRVRSTILNGPRRGNPCWEYRFVKSLEDLDSKEMWFDDFDESSLSLVLPEPGDCDYPVPDENGKVSYIK